MAAGRRSTVAERAVWWAQEYRIFYDIDVEAEYEPLQNCVAIRLRGPGGEVTIFETADEFPSEQLKAKVLLVCK